MSIFNRKPADPKIQQQKAQANADKQTAKAKRAGAKAKQADNKADIQKQHGASHGIMIWIDMGGGKEDRPILPPRQAGKGGRGKG